MHLLEVVDNFAKGNIFTIEEKNRIISSAKVAKLKRKDRFVFQGEFTNKFAYVNKGLFKTFIVDGSGGQHVLSFSREDQWISDLHACVRKMPSVSTIECLQDAELLVFEYDELEKLFFEIPKLESHFRIIMQNRLMSSQSDRFNQISLSAEQRYLVFTANNQEIIDRISLKDIASYLGIFPESLSRIRRNLGRSN
jgi:CRP/FNR family transcriptional regulator, anaerobic regulatory protein